MHCWARAVAQAVQPRHQIPPSARFNDAGVTGRRRPGPAGSASVIASCRDSRLNTPQKESAPVAVPEHTKPAASWETLICHIGSQTGQNDSVILMPEDGQAWEEDYVIKRRSGSGRSRSQMPGSPRCRLTCAAFIAQELALRHGSQG
jgi:hypothetical protein